MSEFCAAIVVPPYASIERPALGPHVLQSVAREKGIRLDIIYANLSFAAEIGEDLYIDICYGDTGSLNGEKSFAAAAWGPSFTKARAPQSPQTRSVNRLHTPSDQSERRKPDGSTSEIAREWADRYSQVLAEMGYDLLGFNLMFEQINPTIALVERLKKHAPDTLIVTGGPLCDGEMAEGIAALSSAIDHVFSGESESTFISFLMSIAADNATAYPRIIRGAPNHQMEQLPCPDYEQYFDQVKCVLPESNIVTKALFWLPYEASRGCWWGQKHHCTFCGINGTGMSYRSKSAEKVVSDLDEMRRYSVKRLLMVDNIMPHGFFSTLLPELERRRFGYQTFFEQKANITFDKMRKIARAEITMIQPGIEALSDDLLREMKKGVKTFQNIATLRYAGILDVFVNWNLLYAFPGDREISYTETADLVPFLTHLAPPSGVSHLSIDRFSPYFEKPEDFGITAYWPMQAYFDCFPDSIDIDSIAYHFEGEYPTASRRDPDSVEELKYRVDEWIAAWRSSGRPNPTLRVMPVSKTQFILLDTREVAAQPVTFIDSDKAMAALTGQGSETAKAWAIDSRVALMIGENFVPLALTTPEVFEAFLSHGSDSEIEVLLEAAPA